MTEPKKKAGIADIANAAGVSPATVSRVLNHPEIVRPDMREKVRQTLRSFSYVPHGAARALASRRSRSVGAVVPTLGTGNFASSVEALQNRLGESGYVLLIANSQYDLEKEFLEVRALLERGIDGLVVVGNERLPETRTLLREYGIPTVVTYVSDAADGIPAVGLDNFQGAYDVSRHLIELGHRRFGILTSPVIGNDRVRARRDGTLSCLADHGVPAAATPVLEVPYTIHSGEQAILELLTSAPRTTAVVCTTDVLAIGAVSEAKRLGLSIPADLSITGFDDVEFAGYLEPPLTSVRVQVQDIGKLAADRLIGLMSGAQVPLTTNIAAKVVIRASTGPVRPEDSLAERLRVRRPHGTASQ